MKNIKSNQRLFIVAIAFILAISVAAVSSMVVQRVGAAPDAAKSPAPSSRATGSPALDHLVKATTVDYASVMTPLAFGVCDTAGPIEVESSAGTAAGTPTAYADLGTAFAAINGGTAHLGVVTIDVCGNTTEAATATLNQVPSVISVTISPAGGASRTITGSLALPLIDINGADNVTINGLNGGGNSLTLSNTSTSATAGTSTIRFINDAVSNTLNNTTVLGSATGATTGNVFFSTTTGSTGNDNNTVNACSIGPAGANNPVNSILSNGTTTSLATRNSGGQITNNSIFDFYNAAAVVASGVALNGSTDWTVTGNSFYQTASRTMAAGGGFIAITVADTSGINFNISNNFVGGSAASAGGTAWTQTGATTHTFIGIRISVGSSTPTSVQNNVIRNINVSTSSTSTINSGISAVTGAINVGNVTGNTIGATTGTGSITWTAAGANQFAGILAGTGTPNGINISNNNIGSITVGGTAVTTLFGIRFSGTATAAYTVSNNTIGSTSTANSITNNSNGSFVGISGTQTAFPASVSNNTIQNLQCTSTGTGASLRGIELTGSISGQTISGNTIRDLTTTSTSTNATTTAAIDGIVFTGSATTNNLITANTIRDLSSTTSGATAVTVQGILITSTPGTTMSRNLIFNLSTASTSATSAIHGIQLFNSAATETIQNNMIRLGTGLSSSINPIIRGIFDNTATSSPTNIRFNSIYIGGTQGGATVNTACINRVLASTMDIRDNILWNNRASTGAPGANTGRHYAIWTTTATGTITTNYNNLFADQNGGAIGFLTSDRITLTDWQGAGAGFDTNSFSTNPLFVDATNATAPDLHLQASNPESNAGQAIAGLTDDFDGQTRPQPAATNPDIGADEGVFTVSTDLQAPTITYTALTNTTSTTDRTLSIAVTDNGSIPTTGIGLPVLYFNKNGGAFSSSQCVFASGSNYNCTTNYSAVGGVILGDVIRYYVVAQDTAGNVSVNPFVGASGLTANPPAAATPPTTPNQYTISSPVTGIITVPGSFPSLTNVGGAFEFINNNVVTGNVTIQITADLTTETGAVALNAFAAPNTITISPTGAPRTISGSANTALIRMNGASRVTIDGSTSGGTDRSLTITNTSVTTPSVILFGSVGTTPVTNDTLKNCIVINGVNTSSAVVISDATVLGNAGFFSDITIQNNDVQKAFVGVFATGGTTPQGGANLTYTQNKVDTSGANAIRNVGLYMQGVNGATVTNNTVGNFSAVEGENDTGIWLATGTGNATVSGNTVNNLGMTLTTGFAPFGIRESSGLAASGDTISNNTVTNLSTTGSTGLRGITVQGSGVTVAKNKISGIQNNSTGTFGSFGIDVVSGNDSVIKNNFISDVNHNMSAGAAFGPDFGVIGIRLGAGTGHKVYNNSVNLFGPHPGTANTSLLSAAFSISTTTQTGIDVRDNIFANNITGGSSSIAHVSVFLPSGGTSAMNLTWNNNSYYFGPTVASQGVGQAGVTAGTNFFTTLGALTAYTNTLGSATNDNASIASTGAVPFATSTDLHITSAAPEFNTGTTIASVTDDIDGDTRPSGPSYDIGADEVLITADLAITKTDGVTTATPGGSVTYTITASNAGPSGATGATVADTFPASLTATWTCVGAGGGTCTASGSGNINDSVNLPAGASVTYTATCTISAGATGSLANTATVAVPGGVTDPTPGNNTATDTDTLSASADLAITKTDGVTTATPGGSVTYTITASNAGPSNTTATVADTFPASLTANWTCVGAGGGTCTAAGSGNINQGVTLPAGGSVTFTATASISASATGTLSNTATVTGAATDPVPGNNSATDSDTLSASADLSITKTDGVTAVNPGGSTTYTITASNSGPSNATGATVADTFPASLTGTWTCVGAGGGTCTASGSGNINDTVNLPSGGSVTYTVSCTISGAATGSISNTATVTAPGGVTDPVPANNSATDTDTVNAAAVGPVTVTSSAGTTTPTDYATLTAAFNAINAGTHQGVITVDIVTSTNEGATPATLNSSGAGAAVYTSINIRPTNDNVTVTGSPGQGFGVIQLNGVDSVTLDGDNPNTAGTNRNLTVTNTTTATLIAASAVRIATSATAPFDSNANDTIKNLILNGNVTGGNASGITSATGSSNSSFGIIVGPNGGASVTAITSVTGAVPAGASVNNLVIDNNAVNQCARGIAFIGNNAASSTGISITNNTIGAAATLTGLAPFASPATTVYTKGIYVQGTTAYTISGNTVQNILSFVATTVNGIEIVSGIGAGTQTISNNTINGVAQNSTATNVPRGILVSNAGAPYTISGNTVNNIQSVQSGIASGTVVEGVDVVTTAASGTISGNKVSKVYNNNPGSTAARGINLGGGSNITVANNFVADVNGNGTGGFTFDSTFGTVGLRVASGTGHKIYSNSVHMSGAVLGTPSSNLLTAAFAITATTLTGLDVRSNIFSNTLTGGTTTAHVSMFLPTNTTSAMNLTLNNNDYNSGADAATQGIAQGGTTVGTGFYLAANFNAATTTPATNLRALTTLLGPATNDDSSKVVDPLFFSNTDLHITGASPMIDAGVNPGALAVDIDGQARVNGAAIDIGADEFFPSPGTLQLSSATYSGNEGTMLPITVTRSGGASGTVGATLTLTNGSATGGAACGAGVDYVNPGPLVLSFGNNVTSQIVNVQLCSDGALADPNETFTATLSAATGGATLGSPLVAIATIIDVPPPLNGSYNVGTGGDYTSLTNPGGIFDVLNFAGATGNVVINITSDLTGESGSIPLNQVAGGFTVTIKPSGAPRAITSTASAVSVIKINDADNVTIDGSTSGGTDRSLTITNANTAASVAVIWLGNSANGAQNNTIKNVILQGGADQSVANVFNFGILMSSSASILTGGADNDNNTYTNNFVKKVSVGIASIGGLATNKNENTVISNNLIGPAAFGTDEVSTLGILIFNENAPQITGNELRFIGDGATTGGSSGRDHVGISLCTGSASWSGTSAPTVVGTVTNANIARNRIHDVVDRATFSAVGIVENCTNTGNPTNNTIANNFIYNILSNGTVPDQGVGIGMANSNGDTVAFNSVLMAGDVDPGAATSSDTSSFGISVALTTNTNLTVKDNISVMNLSSNTGTLLHAAINIPTAFAWGTGGSNNNDWYPTAGNTQSRVGAVGGSTGTFHATLAAWQGATSQDANSISADPNFVSATDLHVQAGSPVLGAGSTIAGITTDIDGETRDNPPDIGADEIIAVAASADLAITKTDGVTTVTAGGSTTYTITASNAGPSAATGATVADTFPASLTGTWTCVGAGGGTCTASGSGNINDTVNLPAGGSVTYTVTATISAAATGSLSNTATVATPGGVTDPTPGNNSATDTDTIGASADLAITKTDGVTTVFPGGSTTYTITASNAGPSNATGATVADTFPAALTGTWTCVGAGGGTCTASGSGNINDTVNLPAGGSVTYTVSAVISGAATGTLSNTATVTAPGGVTDPNPGNNSATDIDTVGALPGMSISDARITEGNSGDKNMTFTVTFNGGGAASAHYHTVNGTALADSPPPFGPEVAHGNDYVPEQNGIVSFGSNPNPEGTTQTRTFNIIIHGDTFKEPNEFFSVVLDQPIGAQITDSTAFGVIVDEDRAYVGDVDHDQKTDINVFRPSDQNWYTLSSLNGNPIYLNFGLAIDKPVPGDYDGDGKQDYAVRRPGAQNTWYVQFSHDFSLNQFGWGIDADLSVQADYDGDDKTDVAVFRNGTWLIRRSSDSAIQTAFFGQAGDIPVPGDFDGDGKADFTVYRSGTWYTQRSSDASVVAQPWGNATDKPVAGDFDGDGRFDYAVFRNGTWYILGSLNTNLVTEFWGQAGDIPVVGDYDGDGTSDVAVFRPSVGVWYILRSSNRTILGVAWGLSGDIPIPAAYQP